MPEYGVGRDILVFKVNADGVQEWDTGPNATFELIISAVSVIQQPTEGMSSCIAVRWLFAYCLVVLLM